MAAPTLKIPIRLHHKQMAFVKADARFLAVVTGIGWGKTYALCVRALLAAYGTIGSQTIQAPNTGVITAPTYPNLRDVVLRTFLELAGPAIAEFNKSEMRVVLTNGSTILFRSVENYEPLRGLNVSWWAADEAALYPEVVFKIMIGRLREFGKKGYAFLATTPKGRDWIYRKWVAEAERRQNFMLIRGRSTENYHLDPEIIQSWQEEYTGDFARQELDGEFVAFEGLIYPEFDEQAHVFRQPVDLRRFKYTVAGVDWGYANPGVMLVCGVDGDDNVWVLHEEYQRQRRIEDWAAVGVELRDTYKVDTWYCDPADPDNIAKLVDAGLNAVAADNRVNTGLSEVRKRLVLRPGPDGRAMPGLLVTGSAPNLITEFGQYQWATNRDGLRDQPRKVNDHCQDSLRYCLAGIANLGGSFSSGGSFSTDGRISDKRKKAA